MRLKFEDDDLRRLYEDRDFILRIETDALGRLLVVVEVVDYH